VPGAQHPGHMGRPKGSVRSSAGSHRAGSGHAWQQWTLLSRRLKCILLLSLNIADRPDPLRDHTTAGGAGPDRVPRAGHCTPRPSEPSSLPARLVRFGGGSSPGRSGCGCGVGDLGTAGCGIRQASEVVHYWVIWTSENRGPDGNSHWSPPMTERIIAALIQVYAG
jgi:hypothetical protein